jgi:hypothetical protein
MQPFSWSSDGMPQFGEPVKTGISIDLPSGE